MFKHPNSRKTITSSSILFQEAKRLGLNPRWETDYGLFSVESGNLQVKKDQPTTRQFFFHTNLNLNGERARFLTKNKHFTRLVLAEAGFKNILFCLPRSRLELEQFFDQHQPIVCKPLLGQQSKEVVLISTKKQLNNCSLHLTFFEKFIQGVEHRCLVLQNEVVAVQRRELTPTKQKPWQRFYINLEPKKWEEKLVIEAKKIAQVFNLGWTGIDFLVEADGSFSVLEVNSAPGIVKIHYPDEGKKINVAKKIWNAVL